MKAADLTGDPWLNAYGMGVLLSTIGILYLAFVRYDDPSHAPSRQPGWMPAVTCLVAVKDDEAIIEPCVRSLLDSSYPDLQVIVVDDASTDGTPEILDRLAASTPVEVLHLPTNVGKKRALVEGVRRAHGEVLVFTDSDCVLAPDAVERCVDALRSDPGLGAVSGHSRAGNADASLLAAVQDVWYDGQFGVAKAAESSVGSVTCVSGPLAAFRRSAIINYFPAWAADEFLGREFRFATDRQLTGYVLGQQAVGAGLLADPRRRPPRRRRAAPASAVAGRLRAVGSGRHRGPARTSVPSSASRCGGRRASCGTCSSPAGSPGAGG